MKWTNQIVLLHMDHIILFEMEKHVELSLTYMYINSNLHKNNRLWYANISYVPTILIMLKNKIYQDLFKQMSRDT